MTLQGEVQCFLCKKNCPNLHAICTTGSAPALLATLKSRGGPWQATPTPPNIPEGGPVGGSPHVLCKSSHTLPSATPFLQPHPSYQPHPSFSHTLPSSFSHNPSFSHTFLQSHPSFSHTLPSATPFLQSGMGNLSGKSGKSCFPPS